MDAFFFRSGVAKKRRAHRSFAPKNVCGESSVRPGKAQRDVHLAQCGLGLTTDTADGVLLLPAPGDVSGASRKAVLNDVPKSLAGPWVH